MKGSTLPRVYTLPLLGRRADGGRGHGCPCRCNLSPVTSHGFAVIRWARRIGIRLYLWQRWLLIHALELDAAGEHYRYRTVLVLVARQNGKTLVKSVLTLYRMFVLGDRYLVGTAQDLSQAREVMNEVLVPMMLASDKLRARFDPDAENPDEKVGIWHKVWSDEYFRLDSTWRGNRMIWSEDQPRYLIKALNRKAGRGMGGVSEVNIDELREQRTFEGWGAISKTVMAQADAQIWCMSNAGDIESVLLRHLRGVALADSDPSLFHAEWSAELGCERGDRQAWAQANPSLGYGLLTEAAIESAYLTDPPNVFRTEVLCQFVDVMNNAIDLGAWAATADPAGSLAAGTRPAICVERAASSDQVVAASALMLDEDHARIDILEAWDDTAAARRGLTELRDALRPAALGWFPRGPGTSLGPMMRKLGGIEIKGAAASEACMTFAKHVDERRILHADDPLLNQHVRHAAPVGGSAAWIFDRGPAETNALWAAAGALHLALNAPIKRRGRRMVIVAGEDADEAA